MAKNLVIVESPAKAKTISKFLGKDYEVKSSFGHIRDLPKKGLSIDIENNFEPKYEVSIDKRKVVRELKEQAKNKEVWLASDEDREGEAIAWHLCNALKLDVSKTKRIVFHEITPEAISNAIKSPRSIDLNLVYAQQARRVLDRLVGYELSPVLWKKIKTGLSAGRVQSVAVRLIVEREREIRNFIPDSFFKITADFEAENKIFNAELNIRPKDFQKDIIDWLNNLKNSSYRVEEVKKKPSIKSPSAPFTTSTLQQEASRKLGFSVRQTMTLAQRLYENGHISYMRTDSTILSGEALEAAKKYIIDNFSKDYYSFRQYKTKNENAQEAHEAIRPTNFNNLEIDSDPQQNKLYQLIWKRTLASQMSQAKVERTEVKIAISNKPEFFISKGEIVKFEGFTKVYGNPIEDVILPDLKNGQDLRLIKIIANEGFNRGPARYSEASLVKKLEDLGIGRPSTYSPTITVIQNRGYVEKKDVEGVKKQIKIAEFDGQNILEESSQINYGSDKSKLIPTAIAELTTDFLTKYFPDIVNYDFTAQVEENFDRIANGNDEWRKVIKKFYEEFHPRIIKSEDISRKEVSKMRLIGQDPKNHEPIYARFGRFGPMIQRGESDDEDSKKPEFAPIPKNATIEGVTLEEALKALSLPRLVGTTKDKKDILANIGRFGPYIKVDDKFISIKPHDPHNITLDEALDLIAENEKKIKERNIKEFKNGIKILKGPYGPYVTDGKKNARIPKNIEPSEITESKAQEMIKNAKPTKRKFKRSKK